MKRKLLYPKQISACPNGHVVTERKRKPCPKCGSMNRTVVVFADDDLGAKDKA